MNDFPIFTAISFAILRRAGSYTRQTGTRRPPGRNETSKPSMFQSLGPLLSLLGGGSFTKLLLFLLKGLFA